MRVCEVFQAMHGNMRSWEIITFVMDEIQKSHRKTGCINSQDQEITCFNICLLVVHCRKGVLCQMPGTGRQKILSCRMSLGAGGEQFVLRTDGFPCVALSRTSDSTADTRQLNLV